MEVTFTATRTLPPTRRTTTTPTQKGSPMKANFNGQEADFTIRPDQVSLFEATLPGGSAVALLRKFTDGNWSAADVAHVLSFALHGPSREARLAWEFARTSRRYGL